MAGNKPTTKIKSKDDRIKGKKILAQNQNTSDGSLSGSPSKSTNDLSVIRKSIPTSIVGFRQMKRLYDSATEEVQNLLSNECDLIYECRVCRNIFRSLANFLSHKRIYCKQKFNKTLHAHFMATSFLNDDTTDIFSMQVPDEKHKTKTSSTTNSHKKDLTSIIDKLGHREDYNKLGLLEYYDEMNYRIAQKDAYRTEHAIRLDNIDSNKSAVFQTIVKKDGYDTNNEFVLDEVIELHDMLWKENAVLGPDGKLLAVDENGQIKDPKIIQSKFSDDEDDLVKCDICALEFKTRKTLLYHMKIKHTTSHMHYPCPSCSDIFSTAGSVYRHLCKVHNNTMVTVRKLRDQILNKGFTLDNASKKMLDRINKKSEDTVVKNEHQDENDMWMLDFELDFDTLRCSRCGRKFERRAALTSHQIICRNRVQSQNKFSSHPVKKIVEGVDNEETASKNNRKSKAPMKKIKNVIEMEAESVTEIVSDAENPDGNTCDNSNVTDLITSQKIISNNIEINAACKINEVKINKRKRQHTTKIPNESTEDSEELYWEMNEDGSLSVKRPKESLKAANDSITEDLKKKMFSLINEKKLQCIPCKKKFPSLTNLKRHIALHMKWKRFQCGLCTAQFYHRSECVYHLGRSHNMMGDKQFADALILPIQSQDSEIHIDNDLSIVDDDPATNTKDVEINTPTTVSYKDSIDTAIDDVILKYTEHDENSDEIKDPLSTEATMSTDPTENMENTENTDNKDSAENSDNKESPMEIIAISPDVSKEKNAPEVAPVRKRGRPRSVFTERTSTTSTTAVDDDENREKRGRGRPKGSLNKDKKKKSTQNKEVEDPVENNSKSENGQPQDEEKMRKMVLEVIFGGEKKEEVDCDIADNKSEDSPSPDTDVSCASVDYDLVHRLKKTKSSESLDPSMDSRSCRPIRNRVKVVNKDFVYDLSDLLKKEAEAYKESQYTVAYTKFKKRSNSVTQVDNLLNKDYEDTLNVSPANSEPGDEMVTENNSSEEQSSPDNADDEKPTKSLRLFGVEQVEVNKGSTHSPSFKINPSESYKRNDSLEQITVIPVNISNNSADDSSSSSDEMPLLEINMTQDVDSNDELDDPLGAHIIGSSDPDSSCPDITGDHFNEPPVLFAMQPDVQSTASNTTRSVLKQNPSKMSNAENRLNRVYIRKPSGDLQEIIFETPISIGNSNESTDTSVLYKPDDSQITKSPDFMQKNSRESMNATDKNNVLRIINESLPLQCNSVLTESSSSESEESDNDY